MMEDLIKSHRQIQFTNLIEWAALKTNTHLGAHPFDANKDVAGDFIYSTNRNCKKYSPVYPALTDLKYIHSNCSMDMGYTDLLVCKKIELIRGAHLMATSKYEINGQSFRSDEGNYCVFQDPFTKLFEHGPNDVLMITDNMDKAREFAVDFTRENEISTLITQIKFHIYWH
jgi:hypothetical protein